MCFLPVLVVNRLTNKLVITTIVPKTLITKCLLSPDRLPLAEIHLLEHIAVSWKNSGAPDVNVLVNGYI